MNQWIISHASQRGGRAYQEDRSAVFRNKDQGLFLVVVSDGVGGHGGGDRASQAIIDTAELMWREVDVSTLSPKEFLNSLCVDSNSEILLIQEESGLQARATIVALMIFKGRVHWIHSGDSRLYHFDTAIGRTHRTKDHSVLQILVDTGKVKEEEMGTHADQGKLLQSLGEEDLRQPAYDSMEVKSSDSFLLCTDGFWERISRKELERLVASGNGYESALRSAVELAVERGGQTGDNVTAAIVIADESNRELPLPIKSDKIPITIEETEAYDEAIPVSSDQRPGPGKLNRSQLAIKAVSALAVIGLATYLGVFFLSEQEFVGSPVSPLAVPKNPPPPKDDDQERIEDTKGTAESQARDLIKTITDRIELWERCTPFFSKGFLKSKGTYLDKLEEANSEQSAEKKVSKLQGLYSDMIKNGDGVKEFLEGRDTYFEVSLNENSVGAPTLYFRPIESRAGEDWVSSLWKSENQFPDKVIGPVCEQLNATKSEWRFFSRKDKNDINKLPAHFKVLISDRELLKRASFIYCIHESHLIVEGEKRQADKVAREKPRPIVDAVKKVFKNDKSTDN